MRIAQLLQGVDRDLRLIDKGQLTDEERKQRDEAKSLAQRARRAQQASGGNETQALSLALAASNATAPLVRRQLRLDTLMAAAEEYRQGRVTTAVTSLSESLASDLGAPVRYIEESRDRLGVQGTAVEDVNDRSLAALCLLETEVAFSPRYDSAARLGLALRLLDAADPAGLPPRFVERWYIVVAGHLQGEFLLVDAMLHLEQAIRRFPNDADVLAAAGAFYEMLALPSVELPEKASEKRSFQARERSGGSSGVRGPVRDSDSGVTYTPPGPVPRELDEIYEQLATGKKTGLARAEELYRRALTADAAHQEAHLRLGRVLSVASRPDAALPELRLAAASRDPRVHYLGSMFEGALHESAEQANAAVACYQDAVRTCPDCLSGAIALSHAQRRAGAPEVATKTLDAATARNTRIPFADFWWDYPLGACWQTDSLLRELRGALR